MKKIRFQTRGGGEGSGNTQGKIDFIVVVLFVYVYKMMGLPWGVGVGSKPQGKRSDPFLIQRVILNMIYLTLHVFLFS